MTQAILFDMDGVLIDSAPYHKRSWELLAEENGLVTTDAYFWSTFGKTNRAILPAFFGRPLSEEEMVRHSDRKEALFRELMAGSVVLFPGLRPLIEDLHSAGWLIAIGSSAPRQNVTFAIEQLDLEGLVSAYTCMEDVTHGKPHPEVFLKAAEKLGVAPECCVVVEDAVHGVEAARAAGMKCVAITTTNPREILALADRVIDNYHELTEEHLVDLLLACPSEG